MDAAFPTALPASPRALRYGENPQQRAVLVPIASDDPLALGRFAQCLGPTMSYTNWLDADAALYCRCQIADGAWLGQEVADARLGEADLEVVSRRAPTAAEWADLRFAWAVVAATRSNAVVVARDGQLVGSGAGQPDRLRAAQLAVAKAGERAAGAVAAADAFFPFVAGDAPEVLLDAGITALVQPFGGRNDAELVALCDARASALVRTRDRRGFRH